MTVFTLVSVKGSPGVTTAAAAMTAAGVVGGESALLVELDPSGGDVRLLATVTAAEPNLLHAAAELRHQGVGDALASQAVEVLPALPALLAPAGVVEAEMVMSSIGDGWGAAFRAFDGLVMVDGGRWDPGQATARRVEGADVVGLVVRATAVSVEHARHTVTALRLAARAPVAAVVVGDRPHPPEAVAAALDLPLAGSIAWDPRGASWLWAKGATAAGVRSSLARSATRVLGGLESLTEVRQPARVAAPEFPVPPPPPPPPRPPAATAPITARNGGEAT